MKMWAIVAILLLGMSLLPSCREKSQMSSRAVVTAIGIDADGEGGCALSVQAVEALKTAGSLSQQEGNATKVYTGGGQTVSAALGSFISTLGRSAYILHNQAIVIGMEQAQQQTLTTLTDYFMRNYQGRPLVDMVMTRGRAEDVLRVPSAAYAVPAEQLTTLLEEAAQWGLAVRTHLLDIERANSGMFDAVMPIVAIQGEGEDQMLVTDGTALFRDGKYAGELDAAGTRGLLYGRNEMQRCLYTLDTDQWGAVSLQVSDVSTRVEVSALGQSAAFAFSVSCRAEILEEHNTGVADKALLEDMSERLERQITEDIEGMLEVTIRQYGCDVLGLCRRLKKQAPSVIRGFEEEWPERLRECRYTVEVSAQVNSVGAQIS